ncbi:alginate lyase family protein [Pseudomonadota bacterium]
MFAIIPRLGYRNVAYVVWYRVSKKVGLWKIFTPVGSKHAGGSFNSNNIIRKNLHISKESQSLLNDEIKNLRNGKLLLFSKTVLSVGSPPNWYQNPFNKVQATNVHRHWSVFGDFDQNLGDIKTIWELSRFSWASQLARHAVLEGDKNDIDLLNIWLNNWIEHNPTNTGLNWMSAQEAAIRVFNITIAAYILDSLTKPQEHLIRFVCEHANRLATDIRYGIAQDNNHGTSEACALFIVGVWLSNIPCGKKRRNNARKWEQLGRHWLENRVLKLIEIDGSFSQRSINYHRFMLDILSLVELVRKKFDANYFSTGFQSRVCTATEWLYNMVDPKTGLAPNFGANDGTLLLRLNGCSYRDFRPCIQLASALYYKKCRYPAGAWDEALDWFGIEKQPALDHSKRSAVEFNNGGYVTLKGSNSWALIHSPRYRFRPNHADALHFDLWINGMNILCDSGSYSYNNLDASHLYFPSTEAHNTVQFDDGDQMPRLGHFLYACWKSVVVLEPLSVQDNYCSWAGHYRDYKGHLHDRKIVVCDDFWEIDDKVSNFSNQAVLRWHLSDCDWRLINNTCVSQDLTITIDGDVEQDNIRLSTSARSLYYMERKDSPCLIITIKGPSARILTTISSNFVH